MGRIQSGVGLTTGLDIQKTVEQLISVSAQPRDRLQLRIKSFQSQQVAINELTALTIGIQLQSDRLGKAANLTSTSATSSKPDALTVSASGTPVPGTYAVQTLQTAQTSTASSNPFTSSSDLLQAGEFVVRTGGFVDASPSVDDLRGGAGILRGKIRITDRTGTSREVDLRFAANTDDVLKAINNTADLRVSAKTVGDRIVLSDLSGQSNSNLIVEEVGEGRTAVDLGLAGINVAAATATGDDINFISNTTRLSTLRDGRGIAFAAGDELVVNLKDGSTLRIDANLTKTPSTVGQLITNINAIGGAKLEAKLNADGSGLELVDKTTGTGIFATSGSLADQLGFTDASGTTGTITGTRVQSTLQGPLLNSLKGGKGIGTPESLSITNRAGVNTNVNLAGSISLRDIIDKINGSSAGVTASLNKSRTGIVLQDVTGSSSSNLIVGNNDSNNTATKLNLAANVERNTVDSNSLGAQYISETTELKSLNQGRGVRLGSFTITNAAGAQKSINLAASSIKNVGDVLKAINSADVGVLARLNDEGDGILLADTSVGSGTLTIADTANGNTALDLGIRGTGKVFSGPRRQEINGSQTFRLTFSGTETLDQVAEKLNSSNGPLNASLLTSGPNTVRLLFTSRASGEIGRVVAEGDAVGLSINSSGIAKDAIISIGSAGVDGGTLVRSSTNSFSTAITGLTLTAKGVSTTPVDVTVSSSTNNIEKNLQLFVDQFNKVRDKIDKETSFNADTKTTGQLFGATEILRVEQTLARFVQQRSFASGKVQSLEQLGVGLDEKGKLSLDKTKLEKITSSNLSDVQDFLTKEKTGFAARAQVVLNALVGEKNSVLVSRSQALQRTIESSSRRSDALTARLDKERERLSNQFYALESNLAKIRNNGSALNQLNASASTSA